MKQVAPHTHMDWCTNWWWVNMRATIDQLYHPWDKASAIFRLAQSVTPARHRAAPIFVYCISVYINDIGSKISLLIALQKLKRLPHLKAWNFEFAHSLAAAPREENVIRAFLRRRDRPPAIVRCAPVAPFYEHQCIITRLHLNFKLLTSNMAAARRVDACLHGAGDPAACGDFKAEYREATAQLALHTLYGPSYYEMREDEREERERWKYSTAGNK